MFPFCRVWAYAGVWAARNENEMPLRHNTSTGIFNIVYVVMFGQWKHWIQITSHLNSLEGSMILLVLLFASNFVFTWVIHIACVCARVASESRSVVTSVNHTSTRSTGITHSSWSGCQNGVNKSELSFWHTVALLKRYNTTKTRLKCMV